MKLIVWLLLPLTLSSCGGVDEMRWREEVWLHDGRFIIIDRYATATKSGFPDSRRGDVLTQEIHYSPMNVAWSTKGSGEQPISFELINGVAYLVVTARADKDIYCLDKPKGEYIAIFYRWKDGGMEKANQRDVPIELMGRNITGISQWGYDKRGDRSWISWSGVADATGQPRAGPPISLNKFFQERSWLRCE